MWFDGNGRPIRGVQRLQRCTNYSRLGQQRLPFPISLAIMSVRVLHAPVLKVPGCISGHALLGCEVLQSLAEARKVRNVIG